MHTNGHITYDMFVVHTQLSDGCLYTIRYIEWIVISPLIPMDRTVAEEAVVNFVDHVT